MWEGGGIVYQLMMFIGALGLCFIGYILFLMVVSTGMNVATKIMAPTPKVTDLSKMTREETEAWVMERVMEYETQHDNELTPQQISTARSRLNLMSYAELNGAIAEVSLL